MPEGTHPAYRVVNKNPKNTGTKSRPIYGPSGVRKDGTKVYTREDEKRYNKTYDGYYKK